MGKVPVSVVIIAKDEEKNISACLESVKWAREIVLVDGESADRTVEIAKQYTDKIYTRRMDIEGRHRNFAYAQATQAWILSLDADERVSLELSREIDDLLKEDPAEISGCAIPIKTFIGKRWIRKAGYYPARKLRLHRNGKFRYEESSVHPRAFLDGKERSLKADILHFGFRDFHHFIDKLNNQTTLEAQKWVADGRKITPMKVLFKASDRFWRNYCGKGGFKDGFLGFMMSVLHALYQLFTYTKYLELKNAKHES
ncbi:MAG: glycosyltransferase family 2 protein [Candidatus Omnitrophica bacterium]|nr:glycosyltransferase family 2 protein [Candidatus Omnitrophota bacterium]